MYTDSLMAMHTDTLRYAMHTGLIDNYAYTLIDTLV